MKNKKKYNIVKIVLIDDNVFYLKKLAIKIKAYLHEKKIIDGIELIQVGKANITDYEKIDDIAIAIIDYSFLVPGFKKNGIDIAKEILEKSQATKIIINSAINNAKVEVEKFNITNNQSISFTERSFEDILRFLEQVIMKGNHNENI